RSEGEHEHRAGGEGRHHRSPGATVTLVSDSVRARIPTATAIAPSVSDAAPTTALLVLSSLVASAALGHKSTAPPPATKTKPPMARYVPTSRSIVEPGTTSTRTRWAPAGKRNGSESTTPSPETRYESA